MPQRCDVAVFGAGPAGAATAITLARQDIATIVVDPGVPRQDRPGESLAPAIRPFLDRLGIMDDFLATGPLPCFGNRSSWGGDGSLVDHDFIRDAHGHGWHVDRGGFDAMLQQAARSAGASILGCVRATAVERVADGWQITVAGPDGVARIAARWIVDASGRTSAIAGRLRARRTRFDHLVAAVAFLTPHAGRPEDSTTLVEAVEAGWWYSALLPDGRVVVMGFTDPDVAAYLGLRETVAWWRLLGASRYTRERVAAQDFRLTVGAPRLVAAGSSLLRPVCGEGWLAVGDAAATFEPLSSFGIGSAIASGIEAGDAIGRALRGDHSAVSHYAARLERSYAHYLALRDAYYRQERRWPDAPFWQRRQASVPA